MELRLPELHVETWRDSDRATLLNLRDTQQFAFLTTQHVLSSFLLLADPQSSLHLNRNQLLGKCIIKFLRLEILILFLDSNERLSQYVFSQSCVLLQNNLSLRSLCLYITKLQQQICFVGNLMLPKLCFLSK